MIRAWLDMSPAGVFLVLIGLYFGMTLLLAWITFCRPFARPVQSLTGVVAPFFSGPAILFALLTGFLAADVAERGRQAYRVVHAEAGELRNIHTLSVASVSDMRTIRTALKTYVTSVVVISLVWFWLFNPQYGLLNWLLGLVGLGPVGWLIDPEIALWSIILSTIVIVPGSGVVLYSAAIGAIPRDLYEAAEVEGAGALAKWRNITIPLLQPTTLYLTVIYTIAAFQVFDRVFVMTRGGPLNSTTTIVQLIYATAFNDFNFGRASAQALVLFFIIAAFSFVQFRFLSTEVEY